MAAKAIQKTVGTALAGILCSSAALAAALAPAASGSVSPLALSGARPEASQPLAKRTGTGSTRISSPSRLLDATTSQIPCRPLHISSFGSFGPAFSHSVAQAIAQASANCPNRTVVKLQTTTVKLETAQSYQNLVRSDQRQLARLQQTKGIGVGLILGMENFLIVHQATVSS